MISGREDDPTKQICILLKMYSQKAEDRGLTKLALKAMHWQLVLTWLIWEDRDKWRQTIREMDDELKLFNNFDYDVRYILT